MRYLYISIFTTTLLFFTSCKGSPYHFQKDGIEFQVKEDKIIVTNQEYGNLYYFIINRSELASIFWVPRSADDNKIQPLQYKDFLLEEILGYTESMYEVSFFYWRSGNPEPGEAIHVVLELKK